MADLSDLLVASMKHISTRFSGISRSISQLVGNGKNQLVTFLNTSHFLTLGISGAVLVAFFMFCVDEDLVRLAAPDAPDQSQQELSGLTEISGEIRPGDSLTSSLQFYGVDRDTSSSLIDALRDTMDLRRLKPNDRYTLVLDDHGSLLSCLYEEGPLDIHAVERCADGSLQARKLDVSLDCRTVKIAGRLDSSLYAAFSSSGEDPKLVYAFADIFASKIDFNTETRRGDNFELVLEKYYKGDDFVGYGKILMARYHSKVHGPLEAFHFEQEPGKGSYYDVNGQEFGTAFIKSPVPMARVTSTFTYTRLHPIFNYVRPHLGIDLAAPVGSPVMSVADGKVVFAGWKGGYGKQVIVEHSGGYKTHYAHLSRFADGIRVGARVRQKQIIAYVGSTGNSTGPHLDYRLSINGTFTNPFGVKFRPKSELSGKQLARFKQATREAVQLAQTLEDPRVVLVRNVLVTQENRPSFL